MIETNATGLLTTYIESGGYGFIETTAITRHRDDGPNDPVDVFFHISDYPGSLPEEGEELRFDIERTDDGDDNEVRFAATNIEVIGKREINQKDRSFASQRPRWGRDS